MAAYHQMGHDSWNLVADGNLGSYAGIVLSPVNNTPAETQDRLGGLGLQRTLLDVVFDPQLYQPQVDRGCLPYWKHFPKDMDTADTTNQQWWNDLCVSSAQAAADLRANAVCSPANLPKVHDDDYYSFLVERGNAIQQAADDHKLSALMTCVISTKELTKPGRPLHLASILTRSACRRAYLIFHDSLQPKVQNRDHEALLGAMQLITLLENADMQVLVACAGVDMCLWKRAGASNVATGKFFNLRRFTPGRWEEAVPGGQVVPYWTEFGLFTWLRELDVRLLDRDGKLDRTTAASNPYSMEILELLANDEKNDKWIGLSWRQYLFEFARREAAYSKNPEQIDAELVQADERWAGLQAAELLLYDRDNDGTWIRPWRNAVKLWQRR